MKSPTSGHVFRTVCMALTSTVFGPLTVNAMAEDDPRLKTVVQRAFETVHDGWSTDEVLLQDELNRQFIAACQQELPHERPFKLNWTLLNLRKAGQLAQAGQLKVAITKRRNDRHHAYRHLAEIAARTVQDQYRVNTDRMMCDEELRRAFDAQARLLAKDLDPYLLRKAAFGLRKSRRLKPELLLRIADWNREVTVHRAGELIEKPSLVPALPGIYIFRDATGYLYVGESSNLRERLSKHLDHSDRESLASYLASHGSQATTIEIHAFPKESRARQLSIRRAYESALIASRKPRFNLRP